MTFAEFEPIAENPRGLHHELRHGELYLKAVPPHKYYLTECRLRRRLEEAAGDAGIVTTELGYKPLPEFEYWKADVVLVDKVGWEQVPPDGYFEGAPELVVEVLS